jgi:5-methylcytosine-specific restriction endonuclease McrA
MDKILSDYRNGKTYIFSIKAERRRYFKEVIIPLFNNVCLKCEGSKGYDFLELDHIIPISKGGVDHVWNYQPLCISCNASKGSKSFDFRIDFAKRHNIEIYEILLQK